MKYTLHRICLISFSILLMGNIAYAQTSADMTTLYNRLYSSIYVPTTYNISNLRNDGSFNNVTYPTVQPTPNTGGDVRKHLDEMTLLAKAYKTSGDKALYEAYIKAWDWWYSKDYQDTNWWWRDIGWPKSLYLSFVLMAKDMEVNSPAQYETLRTYLMNLYTPEFIEKSIASPSGANTTDECNYMMATAIVTNNEKAVRDFCSVFSNVIAIVTTDRAEGIQPDFSFSQHTGSGRQLYLGTYGRDYIVGLIKYVTLVPNTIYETPADKIKIFEDLFLKGVSWISYRGVQDHNQYGRKPSANFYDSFVTNLASLVAAKTPQTAKLQTLYDWMSRSAADDAMNVQRGNCMFWRHDYMVHKGANYYTTSRMTSTRTTCNESANKKEGVKNFYTGSGVNYIYVKGPEYLDIQTDMDWRRLPGITTPQWPTTKALPYVDWGAGGSNIDAYAGGTSDGKTGVCGFIFDKNKSGEINLKANKSWFYFDDYFIALGAGITAKSNINAPYYATTINQVKYNAAFVVDADGGKTNLAVGQTIKPIKSDWAYINNVGYQFIDKAQLNFSVAKSGSTSLAWLGINHGTMPQNAQYAYAVYPSISQDQLLAKVANTPFEVLSNTTSIQAVMDKEKNIVQAVFYRAGKLTLPAPLNFVEVNAPSVIQLRLTTDSLFLSVANPYCETTPVASITVQVGDLYKNASSSQDNLNSTTKVTISMPKNEFEGSTVNVGLEKDVESNLITIRDKSSFTLNPNCLKAGEILYLRINAPILFENTAQLYAANGALIREIGIAASNGFQIEVNTAGIKQGLYLLKYGKQVCRFVIL